MNPNTTYEEEELKKLISQIAKPQQTFQKSPKQKVIVISGPTAVGKTKSSLFIAKELGGEIVSADSMQIYRGMDIGTAKVSKKEMMEVPHHLIDIRSLNQSFSVMEFYKEANKAIRDILVRGKVPIVVGAAGFYIHALIYGPPEGPPSVPEVREGLEEEMEEFGVDVLFKRLQTFDPEYAKTITGADRNKIIRALEIIALTNKKVSDFSKEKPKELPYDYRCWFLYREKSTLYPLIEMRCDEMIAKGLIEEVKGLINQGLKENPIAAGAIGYRQCLDFLKSSQNAEDFEQFVAQFKRASRRYAKRQITWFKRESLFRWLQVENISTTGIAEIIIQDYELSF